MPKDATNWSLTADFWRHRRHNIWKTTCEHDLDTFPQEIRNSGTQLCCFSQKNILFKTRCRQKSLYFSCKNKRKKITNSVSDKTTLRPLQWQRKPFLVCFVVCLKVNFPRSTTVRQTKFPEDQECVMSTCTKRTKCLMRPENHFQFKAKQSWTQFKVGKYNAVPHSFNLSRFRQSPRIHQVCSSVGYGAHMIDHLIVAGGGQSCVVMTRMMTTRTTTMMRTMPPTWLHKATLLSAEQPKELEGPSNRSTAEV